MTASTGSAFAPDPASLESLPPGVHETHVSIVTFVGDRAFKLKKPVAMDFLDFTTREAREAVCRHEVELNRRLAPDVYLGVATVVDEGGAPCDHLVVMRRMPPERRLSSLLDTREASQRIREVARVVASFHARAKTSPIVAAAGTGDAVARLWDDNLAALAQHDGTVLPPGQVGEVAHLARRYLAGRRGLFAERVAAGRVVDGHGDLLADDIFCLPDGPRILDCIEFDDRLRHGDVLLDVAFLAMDLERLGHPDLAARLLDWYAEFSGEAHPASLADHYIAYRAQVRAKVACIRHDQGDPHAGDEARQLHQLAIEHLRRARVRLVLVGGLPGTGKSSLAGALADRFGWALLRSDLVRKELAGLPTSEPAPEAFGAGLYGAEQTSAAYAEMLRRARHLLERGESVLLDASWTSASLRAMASDLAEAAAADLVSLECRAPADAAAARMRRRRRAEGDPSDATPEVAAELARRADPWPEAAVVDTGGELDAAVATALALLE